MKSAAATLLVVGLLTFVACATASKQQAAIQIISKIQLNEILTLPIEVSDQKTIEQKFGTPTFNSLTPQSLAKEQNYSGPNDKITWAYFDPTMKRVSASFLFDKQTGKLQTIHWFPTPSDREAEFKQARSALADPCLKKGAPKWVTGHTAPNSVLYFGRKTGVSISQNLTTTIVEAISIGTQNFENVTFDQDQKCY